jgi:hypothetical protein
VGDVTYMAHVGEPPLAVEGEPVVHSVGVGSTMPASGPSTRNLVPYGARIIQLWDLRNGMVVIPAYGERYRITDVRSTRGGMVKAVGSGKYTWAIHHAGDDYVTVLEDQL